MNQPGMTAVYRFYSQDGTLLYVGVADDLRRRWREHATDKPWWSEVRRQTADWYDTRDEALRIEVEAIKTERPVYNFQHSVDRSGLLLVPHRLTAEERDRLLRYDDTPDDAMSEDELLDHLRLVGMEADWDKYRMVCLIRTLLAPPADGQAPERGLFTRVVEASPWTREYVARIRDGKVLVYEGEEIPSPVRTS